MEIPASRSLATAPSSSPLLMGACSAPHPKKPPDKCGGALADATADVREGDLPSPRSGNETVSKHQQQVPSADGTFHSSRTGAGSLQPAGSNQRRPSALERPAERARRAGSWEGAGRGLQHSLPLCSRLGGSAWNPRFVFVAEAISGFGLSLVLVILRLSHSPPAVSREAPTRAPKVVQHPFGI